MPDPTTIELLRGLVLSANDLKSLTDWPDVLVEDYLNIVDNLITIANLLDIEIDQTIEEIPTDFTDGSIPFVEDNLLIEDNTNLVWDSLNNILTALNLLSESITLSGATASRILSTDGDKLLESIADLTAWIAGTALQITVTDDGDGSVTLSIPAPFRVPVTGDNYFALDADGDVSFHGTARIDWTKITANGITPGGGLGGGDITGAVANLQSPNDGNEVQVDEIAGNAGQNLEQCTFACAVATNDPNYFATLDVERNIFQGPDSRVRILSASIKRGSASS